MLHDIIKIFAQVGWCISDATKAFTSLVVFQIECSSVTDYIPKVVSHLMIYLDNICIRLAVYPSDIMPTMWDFVTREDFRWFNST